MKQISQHWAVTKRQWLGAVSFCLGMSSIRQKVFQDVPTCLLACVLERVVYLPGKFHGLLSLLIPKVQINVPTTTAAC
jgi:hypothetical protein